MNWEGVTINGVPIEQLAHEAKLESRANCMPQVDALMAAGWKWELPEIANNWPHSETEPWQWYWRSPPKRAGRKGRKYWSTNQAFNALQKSTR